MVRFMLVAAALAIGVCGWMAQPVQAGGQVSRPVGDGPVQQEIASAGYRVAAGFGLRITVPALGPVPINLDTGFPLKTQGDKLQLFNFYMGMSR